jgi:hypothetical protein
MRMSTQKVLMCTGLVSASVVHPVVLALPMHACVWTRCSILLGSASSTSCGVVCEAAR